MSTRTRTLLTVVGAALALTAGHAYAQHGHSHGLRYYPQNNYYYTPKPAFGAFSHVDDLASRLEALTNQFCLDLYYNYSHNPGFRTTYREAYQLLQVAKYIHAAEHHHNRAAIQQQLGGMDQLFHHLQDDVRGWTRHHYRQIGRLGIITKMRRIESTLHHLMNDVGVAPTPLAGGFLPAPLPAGGFATIR